MNTLKCPICGGKMKRHGKTSAGTQRWQCSSCKSTQTNKIDHEAKLLERFLGWLLSGETMAEMSGGGRSFRRKTSRFWQFWAMPPLIDEIYRVVYIDGIHLGRKAVILIASSDKYVLGWYLARSENSRAWEALMARIAPPEVVVTDGGTGFEKARKRIWPDTEVQRCIFHAFCQVKKYTTSNPRLPAGAQLYMIACDLLHVKTIAQATRWLTRFSKWCTDWEEFLKEQTKVENSWVYTHERLIKARNSLNILINKGTLFTYLKPELVKDGPLPATNNRIEGGVNAPLRQMLRDHRGLSLTRRVKAVFWWCYLHTECPLSPAQILKVMPTDDDIDKLYNDIPERSRLNGSIPRWGDAVVWSEFHTQTPYRMDWD